MPLDTGVYSAQRRGIRSNYRQQSALNAYTQTLAQQRGRRQLADYRQNFQRETPKFTSSYGQRGMVGPGVQSGVYKNAMNNYLGDYTRNLGRMQQDYGTEMNQYKLNQSQLLNQREQQLADVATQKARDIAMTGVYLRNLRPLYGGS